MNSSPIIKQILSLALLIIFLFSITPTKYLHELVADHTDYYGFSSQQERTIHAPGLDCDAEDLVVSVPFIELHFSCLQSLNDVLRDHYLQNYISKTVNFSATKDVRGPPVVII